LAAKDRARGKQLERDVAAKFGFRRRTNGEHGGFDDCVLVDGGLAPISVEAKAYSVLQLRTDWVEQAVRNAGERPWVITQRPKGSRRIYATVDLDWLVQLVRQTERGGNETSGDGE
jgi:hypothetical protein